MITPLQTKQPKSHTSFTKLQYLCKTKEVIVKVNLGSPSKNCLGIGICKIDLLSSRQQRGISFSPCSAIAILKKHSDDRLSIQFKKISLSSRTMETHFYDHTFIMEEDFRMPTSIKNIIDCQPILHRGFYEVTECKEYFTIQF